MEMKWRGAGHTASTQHGWDPRHQPSSGREPAGAAARDPGGEGRVNVG
jgi:hypothetical protein